MEEEAIVSESKWIAVIKPVIDTDRCMLCGTCAEFCPDQCIRINDEQEQINVGLDCCLGCSMCAAVCPVGAIEMVLDAVES